MYYAKISLNLHILWPVKTASLQYTHGIYSIYTRNTFGASWVT